MSVTRKYIYVVVVGIALAILVVSHRSYKTTWESASSLPPSPLPPNPLPPNPLAPNPSPPSPLPPSASPTPLSAQPFPSKIWQSWKDDAEDPTDRTIGFPHQWRVVNPGWRYERITDANMDDYVRAAHGAPIADVFVALDDPILRVDFLRYLILLREGGVWADIDAFPHQPVSDWVPDAYKDAADLVVGIETDHHGQPIWPDAPYSVQLCQYSVLAKPGHPALARLVAQVAGDLRQLLGSKAPGEEVTFEEVMATTGPYAFTRVLMDYFEEVTGVPHTGDELSDLPEPRLIGDVLVLPKESFGWLEVENIREKGDPVILVEHLFIASWRGNHPG